MNSTQHEARVEVLVRPAQLLVGMHAMVEVISTSTMWNTTPTHGKECSHSRGVNQSTIVCTALVYGLKSMSR
jgi:hypothetical protein